jgi:uncharacterized protein (TIGR03435 family)
MRTDSRELLALEICGRASLGERIEMLLKRGRRFSPRASLTPVAAGGAVLLLFTIVSSFAPDWIAFAQQSDRPSFEVASIKRNTSGSDRVTYSGPPDSARFTATNIDLKTLVEIAYKVKDSQILEAPGWMHSERYDIAASPADRDPSADKSRLMLQKLLEDRFKLIVRREIRETPVYALLGSKSGLKLAGAMEGSCVAYGPHAPPAPPAAPGQNPPIPCAGFVTGPGLIESGKTSTAEFADVLANILDRPVIDKTGYTGTFSIRLEFTREGGADLSLDAPGPDSYRPSIFTAIQEQLGLKLESQKALADVLVIDHAEKPDAN